MEPMSVVHLIHVGSAVIWAGAAFTVAWFVSPAAAIAGPAAGPVMGALARGRLAMVMAVVSVLTVLSGLVLWNDKFDGAPDDLAGWILSIGAVGGFVALVIGHGFQIRTTKAMVALLDGFGPDGPTPEQGAQMGGLQQKAMKYGSLQAWVMIVVVTAMALGG